MTHPITPSLFCCYEDLYNLPFQSDTQALNLNTLFQTTQSLTATQACLDLLKGLVWLSLFSQFGVCIMPLTHPNPSAAFLAISPAF